MRKLKSKTFSLSNILNNRLSEANRHINDQLDSHIAIYVIEKEEKILYVGMTRNPVHRRLCQHLWAGKYKIDQYLQELKGNYSDHVVRVYFQPGRNQRAYTIANFFERRLIKQEQPEFNTQPW